MLRGKNANLVMKSFIAGIFPDAINIAKVVAIIRVCRLKMLTTLDQFPFYLSLTSLCTKGCMNFL